VTRGEFADRVIRGLGAEVKLHGQRAFQAQFQTEGGNAANNPANTTLKTSKSTTLPNNTAHVQEYKTPEEGIKATVQTLKGSHHGYERIIRLIKHNAPATLICAAIVESDWGTGEAIGEHDEPLIFDVLDDIKHDRAPNTLKQLEAKRIAS
jgi:hypothetical protein